MCSLQETHLKLKDRQRMKVERWKRIFHENGNQKRGGMAMLVSDKIDFKAKTVTRGQERHYIIYQEDETIINIYVANIGTPKHIKQILTELKKEIYFNIIIVDFNTPQSVVNRPSRQRDQ